MTLFLAMGNSLDRFQGLHPIDYWVIALYLGAVLVLGYYFSRRQSNTEEYFLAGRNMPWFAVGLSLLASILSTITYLSIPGEIIKNGLGANSVLLSYPLVFVVVGYLVVPFFMRLQVTTAYEYLEKQFDLSTRLFGASIFILIRLAWMGTIVFTASGALATISGLSFTTVVLGVTAVGTIYTTLGGMRAVIWTDVVQFFILFGGALFTILYVIHDAGTGPVTWWNDITTAEMEPQPIFSLDPTVRLSWVGMINWTLFWWICTAGGDQVAVQRYLSTDSATSARRSFACNLTASAVMTLLLGLCGMALYSYYQAQLPSDVDSVFPHFIRHVLPRGLAGLVVAALFSAAMSSLDSGINSVSSVVITDYYRRLRRSAASPRGEMILARVVTVAAGIFAILTCFLLDWIPEEMRGNLFDVTGRISSFLVGSLGGMMFLAILKVRCSGRVAMGSALAGMSVGLVWAQGHWLFGLQELAWMWVIPLSTLVTFGSALAISWMLPARS